MTETSIPSFSHAAQQAQQWVNELAEELGWNKQRAYHLLKSVLTALRDWLSPEEVADLSAQLPTLIRGIYFEGWNPSLSPATERKKRDFVIRVESGFGLRHECRFGRGDQCGVQAHRPAHLARRKRAGAELHEKDTSPAVAGTLMFNDRQQAGRELAAELAKLRLPEPVVLALPRGGVPVAAEVAAALAAPLDLVIVRKVGAPGNPELAVAAIVDGDPPDIVLNREIIEAYALSNSDLRALIKLERPGARAPSPGLPGRASPVVCRRQDCNPGRRRCRDRHDDEGGGSRPETSRAARGRRRPARRPARDRGGAIPGSGQGHLPQPAGTFPCPQLPLPQLSAVDRR